VTHMAPPGRNAEHAQSARCTNDHDLSPTSSVAAEEVPASSTSGTCTRIRRAIPGFPDGLRDGEAALFRDGRHACTPKEYVAG